MLSIKVSKVALVISTWLSKVALVISTWLSKVLMGTKKLKCTMIQTCVQYNIVE